MPFYEYRCDKCGCIFDKRLSIADRKSPESEPCPSCNETGHVLQYIGEPPPLHSGDGIANSAKVPGYFKDVLRGIKKANRGSTIDV